MLLAILRCEVLGQHFCFSAQLPQSCGEALKRTVPALELLASGALICAGSFVEVEVRAAECAVLTQRLLPYGNMRLDLLLVDDPVQHRCSAVGRVSDQALGSEIELPLDALDHRPCCVHFFSAVRGRGFDVNNDSGVEMNQVVRRVSVERRAASDRCPAAPGSVGETFFGGVESPVGGSSESLIGPAGLFAS